MVLTNVTLHSVFKSDIQDDILFKLQMVSAQNVYFGVYCDHFDSAF